MACNKYCDCFYCTKDEECPLDHYGDGSAYCGEFECNYAYCKRTECMSYEEQNKKLLHRYELQNDIINRLEKNKSRTIR